MSKGNILEFVLHQNVSQIVYPLNPRSDKHVTSPYKVDNFYVNKSWE